MKGSRCEMLRIINENMMSLRLILLWAIQGVCLYRRVCSLNTVSLVIAATVGLEFYSGVQVVHS